MCNQELQPLPPPWGTFAMGLGGLTKAILSTVHIVVVAISGDSCLDPFGVVNYMSTATPRDAG